jgi:hypothetical protein
LAHPIPTRLSGTYTAAAGRKFGSTVGTAFVVLALIGRWRGHPITFAVLGTVGVLLLAAGFIVPTALRTVERAWMGAAKMISKVTTPVFMGVLYFVVLSPIALLRRILAGNALVHRIGQQGGYWLDRSQTPRSALDRQF